MMSLIFDGILLLPKQSINIIDIENYLYNKSNIPMKISIKPFECHYPRFGESNIDINEFKKKFKNKCYINQKVIHHNHMLKENNIIDYICNNCNLKIKNTKKLIVLFHNSKGYDNSYMIDIFSKIENVRINCLAQNQERFKMLNFRIPNKRYDIKIIDSLSFLQAKLIKYSKDRENILNNIDKDRMTAKKVIISILNGGFSEKYHDDKNINKFLKNIEKEITILHEYFYKINKRIDDEKIYTYKAKSFSRILQDYKNQLLMNLHDYFSLKK